MIYFICISHNNHIIRANQNIEVINDPIDAMNLIDSEFTYCEPDNPGFCGNDTETTGLDANLHHPILLILNNFKSDEIVINTIDALGKYFAKNVLKLIIERNYRFILANAKFDYKMIFKHYDIQLNEKLPIYDVIIADRRIWQGLGLTKENPLGIRFGLIDIVKRRLGKVPQGMDKEITAKFIGAKSYFIFTTEMIEYAAADVRTLYDVYKSQQVDITKYNLHFLIEEIENPLTCILGEAELEGFPFGKEDWLKIYTENRNKAYEFAVKLDNEIVRLVETTPPFSKTRDYFNGGKWKNKRQPPLEFNNIGLFGEPVRIKEIFGVKKKKLPENVNCMNYDSSDQIIDLFARLGEPLPTKYGDYTVAEFVGTQVAEIGNSYMEFTLLEAFVQAYLIDNPNSIMTNFMKMLLEFKYYNTRASNFGKAWVEKFINPKTNRIHTIFRQCNALNGRLQSGNEKENLYNCQNVPADKKYRHCFIAAGPDREILTADLSGAETVIMASKAQDTELIRMAIKEDDIHSPVAQQCWRNIYLYRAGNVVRNDIGEPIWSNAKEFWANKNNTSFIHRIEIAALKNKTIAENLRLSREFIINKSTNKPLRTAFKSTTFGSVYGMYKKRAAKTLNVQEEEGQIVLYTIKGMIPKTFQMVEKNVAFMLQHGFLVFNTRTNSRLWFPALLRAAKNKTPLDFMEKSDAEGAARNTPISGTQADMVKEMMVEIYYNAKKLNYDIKLRIQVHDELVYDIPKNRPDIQLFIVNTMKEVALRYLTGIEMGVEYEVLPYWTK